MITSSSSPRRQKRRMRRISRSRVAPAIASSKVVEFRTAAKDTKAIGDLREQQAARRKVWNKARARMDFLEASVEWRDAICIAQLYEIADAGHYDRMVTDPDRAFVRNLHRGAVLRLMMTPAPDMAAVKWKRSEFHRKFANVSESKMAKAIADDMAWLEKNLRACVVCGSRAGSE